MSGITLAASSPPNPDAPKRDGSVGGVMGSISFLQVQMVAYIVVFSVSGLVPMGELIYVVFASVYTMILAHFVFPRVAKVHPPGVLKVHKWFPYYVGSGSVVGLFLPMAYVLGGFARGEQVAVAAATPQLFLLSCQLLTENVITDMTYVSLPVRAIVPIMYNARRLVSIGNWMRVMYAPDMKPGVWTLFGQTLSSVNMAFWAINLFVFLVPMFLPRAFRKHFELEEAKKEGVPETKLVEGHESHEKLG